MRISDWSSDVCSSDLAATVVFDSTAKKLFELPNSLTISQIFARTGRGDRRWLADMTRNGAHGVVRNEPRTRRFNITSAGDRGVRSTAFDASTDSPHAGMLLATRDVNREESELAQTGRVSERE